MTTLRFVILAMMFVGTIFIVASRKKRSYLDSQLFSNNTKYVIGFFLVLMGIVFAVAALLKGVL